MLKNNLLYNENVKANTKEIELLKKNFSNYFDKNGEFLFNQFQNMLKQNDVILNKEGYELKFLGKSYARYLSSTKTETFIAPHSQHNEIEKNKNSENIYIIGDNIDALKHLLGSYAGKIKCIYIDPPYNTGSDGFIYPDNFKFTTNQLANIIGIDENEAERILNLSGKSSHSAWLTFMYPRLILARDLLSDDGVIFISIDDNEQANLKLVCDEIFGEENFAGEITVVNNPRGRDYGGIANMHEYLLVYRKSLISSINNLNQPNKVFPFFDNISGFEMRELRNRNITFNKENRANLYYPFYINTNKKLDNDLLEISLTNEEGFIELYPKESQGVNTVWRWGKEKAKENLNINIAAKKMQDGGYMIIEKYRKLDVMARSVWNTKDDNSEKGTLLVKKLFNGVKIFDFPKSLNMIKKIIEMGTNKNSIILDFFSGSGTTAHAVMKLNSEDGGNRKYICVQIPEKIAKDKVAYKQGYRTIDEIGRKRIELSAEKIKEETNANIDYGFKLYSLETLQDNIIENLNDFEDNPKLIPEDMIKAFDTDITEGKNSILTTWLVLDGYGLTKKTEKYKLKNFESDKIENSLYIIQKGFSSEDVIELIRKIETIELDITRIVIYAHSIIFNVLQELRKNLKNLRNNKNVELIERY
ncbi:site-specific DNA-methyltransferase [Fusobacterium polymorphum]|uniref:DNA methylase n=1 Tax=Fusobacterium nucleatum subsp. polymorphum TaxID=76857 RepID=A0A2C6B383_FUSNP|nr:site-specific DNA-methyltransferase [Fusobacterium polymorphum]PHH98314.1 DNA methylase [Fusobacterium polymorphum]PIM74706.1 site-specific DNA-methyltransferase [Fusobacterium polymorphum]